jgi:hypothetical protein
VHKKETEIPHDTVTKGTKARTKIWSGRYFSCKSELFSIFSFLHNVGLWIILLGMRASVLEMLRFGTENVTDLFLNFLHRLGQGLLAFLGRSDVNLHPVSQKRGSVVVIEKAGKVRVGEKMRLGARKAETEAENWRLLIIGLENILG